MKNIMGFAAIIFFLANQFCLSQTDSLNIKWNQNPPQDSVLFYRLYRACAIGEQSDTNFSILSSSPDYTLIFNNINDSSRVDRDDRVILSGNFIKYTVTAVNMNGESIRANPKGVGIPRIRWVETYSILYNDSVYIIPYDSTAYDLDNEAIDLKFKLDDASLQNITVNIDSLNHNLQVSSDLNNYTGPASFILEVYDPDGFWDKDTVSLEFIEDINVYLNTDRDTTDEDTQIEINLIENDSLPIGYSYSLVVDGSNLQYGKVEILNDSVVSYIPLPSANSLLPDEIVHDYFRYRLRINGLLTNYSNIEITIMGLNDRPVINTISSDTVYAGFDFAHQVIAVDPDSGDVITFLPLTPALSFLTINSETGIISGSPSLSDTGLYDITVQARDISGSIASQSYQIIVITPPELLGQPFAFPNPYRRSRGYNQVFFDNIPSDAEKIVIFDVATNEVYSHNFRGTPTRRWGWNVINDDGKELASGLYIYVIFGPGNKKIKSGKIAVIR